MAFRPNSRQQRAERDRNARSKQAERLKKLQDKSAQRKAERDKSAAALPEPHNPSEPESE